MKRLLFFTAFIGGMATLAIEMTLSRLLGFFFGFSDLVYSFVIGTILIYLSIGYFVGGKLADRDPSASAFFRLIIWTSLLIGVIPVIARPFLYNSALGIATVDIPRIILWGVPVMLIIAAPLVLLGCISPYLIRLTIENPGESGTVAGRIYAISTLGSMIGVFAPSLFLIPLIGALRTFHIFAFALLALGLVGLFVTGRQQFVRYLWSPAALVILLVLTSQALHKAPPVGATVLYETESAYNYIQVAEYPDQTRVLILNEGLAIHSVYNPNYGATFTGQVWDYALVGPYFNAPPYAPENIKKVMVIGLAAGTIPRQYTYVYGEDVHVDGIEIDPKIVQVGRDYFDMNEPNLNVIIGDGRVALKQLDNDYQVVQIDAYKVPYVPWQLTTVEFFQELRSHLAPDGVVSVNVGRSPTNREMIEAISRSMMEVFPSVHVVDVPNTFNSFIYATNSPTTPDNLIANAEALDGHIDPVVPHMLRAAHSTLQPTVGSDFVMTDDRAPIEFIVHKLALDYVLFGDLNSIRDGQSR